MIRLVAIFAVTIFLISPAEARKRHRSGGLICGLVQMTYFGIKDQKYRLAKMWGNFPRTTAHAGAVVVQRRNGRDSAGNPGYHVSRIEQMTGSCSAIVADEKGRYERDICGRGAVYVNPNAQTSGLHL